MVDMFPCPSCGSMNQVGQQCCGDCGKVFDYYNAWAFHYSLFWLNQINPGFDTVFLEDSLYQFVKYYKFFFSTDGIPIMGRSIPYRLAAPAPLIAAAYKGMGIISPGLARRVLDCVWRYFVRKEAVSRGSVTQGSDSLH